jgi:hypothetical protein
LQARTGLTIKYLHQLIGAKLVTQTSSAGEQQHTPKGSSSNKVVPSDTLELLLEMVIALQRRSMDAQEPQGTTSEGATTSLLKARTENGVGPGSGGDTIEAIVQAWGPQQQQAEGSVGAEAAGAVFLAELQCWQTLTALVEFSRRNQVGQPIGELLRLPLLLCWQTDCSCSCILHLKDHVCHMAAACIQKFRAALQST